MKKQLLLLIGLFTLAISAIAQDGVPLFTKDFTPEEFAQRRNKVYEALGANALAVVQGAPSPVGYVRFRQSNEFYYLCGIEAPHAYLLLEGSGQRASLYLPHRNADLYPYFVLLDTEGEWFRDIKTFHIAVRSPRRCRPSHKVCVPGSPSLLRPRNPPRLATMCVASRKIGGVSGGMGLCVL